MGPALYERYPKAGDYDSSLGARMRIAVVGTGGYFGCLPAQDNDVVFIARGRQLEAIQKKGLKVVSKERDLIVFPAEATDDPRKIESVDVVLSCVKLYDAAAAAATLPPLIGPETRILTLQTGIDGIDQYVRRRTFLGERLC